MADERKRPGKSESLTIRLNPRSRFVLEFVARMRGQTITTVVERALEAAGEHARIRRDYGEDHTWKEFWDVSEGVRALRLAAEPEVFPTYEEEQRLEFARRFREYFFVDDDCKLPHRTFVEVLWPNIDKFVITYEETKSDDHWAAERELRAALLAANVQPPKSRSGTKDPARLPPSQTSKANDLDDDIPF